MPIFSESSKSFVGVLALAIAPFLPAGPPVGLVVGLFSACKRDGSAEVSASDSSSAHSVDAAGDSIAYSELIASGYTLLASAEREPNASSELRFQAADAFERAYRRSGKKEDAEKSAVALDKVTGPDVCRAMRRAAFLRSEANRSMAPLQRIRTGPCEVDALHSLFPVASIGQSSITGVETWPGSMFSRVVIALDAPPRGQPRFAEKSAAVVLSGTRLGNAPTELMVGGLLERIRFRKTDEGTEMTWLTRSRRVTQKVFVLADPFRLVLDFAVDPTSERKLRPISKVALDPGHGGNDPGAIGPFGLREKDVTLHIAHLVAPVLARQGISVVITRDDDRTMSLEERTARVNASEADLFVSIHCNAAERADARGVETYTLDTNKDAMSSRIAARENATSVDAAATDVGGILASLHVSGEARSTRLAELLQKSAVASLRPKHPDLKDGGVKHAGFYVLVGARMPAVLFETSYISNPNEERLLGTEDYRLRLADSIVNAVLAFREGK